MGVAGVMGRHSDSAPLAPPTLRSETWKVLRAFRVMFEKAVLALLVFPV